MVLAKRGSVEFDANFGTARSNSGTMKREIEGECSCGRSLNTAKVQPLTPWKEREREIRERERGRVGMAPYFFLYVI